MIDIQRYEITAEVHKHPRRTGEWLHDPDGAIIKLIDEQAKEIERLKDELKEIDIDLGFALCHSDFSSTRDSIKELQNKVNKLQETA